MKKFFLTLLIAIFFILFSGNIIGQTSYSFKLKSQPWNFDKYKIAFRIPKKWKITQKNGFIATSSKGVVLKISSVTNKNATAQSIANMTYIDYKFLKEKKILRKKNLWKIESGLEKYVIAGKAIFGLKKPVIYKNKPVFFGIVGIVNPKTKARLFFRVFWFKDTKYTKENTDITYQIAKSFKAIK